MDTYRPMMPKQLSRRLIKEALMYISESQSGPGFLWVFLLPLSLAGLAKELVSSWLA